MVTSHRCSSKRVSNTRGVVVLILFWLWFNCALSEGFPRGFSLLSKYGLWLYYAVHLAGGLLNMLGVQLWYRSLVRIWIMAILCRTPSGGAVECARRTAVISHVCLVSHNVTVSCRFGILAYYMLCRRFCLSGWYAGGCRGGLWGHPSSASLCWDD